MPQVFSDNPRRRDFDLTDPELARLCADAAARFSELPLHHRGESAELRSTAAPGILVQRLIPSLNSISRNRKGSIEGTDRLRLDISRVFWAALHRRQLATCHLAWHEDHLLVTEERIPPIEVIVKAALIGTPTRIYHGLLQRTDRHGRDFELNERHEPYVRFDYRNPLRSATGEGLRDECMPLALADRLIDTQQAARSALGVFEVVHSMLARLQLDVWDACFLFDETGRTLSYELSPDNMRIKLNGWTEGNEPRQEFDKDLWRNSANAALLREQWAALRERLERSLA
ncbi:MAG: phosphoribosylaminoimidazolesuccinocarboxamide synthase [Polyangiaceae bacterium]